MEEGGDVADVWQRVVISFGLSVEATVVTTEVKGSIIFYHDVQGL